MELHKLGELSYYVHYPEGYEVGKRYPVIMYLHGAGTRYSHDTILNRNRFLAYYGTLDVEPFIGVLPLCEADSWFSVFEHLRALVREVADAPYAERERLYLMGNSMGGYGTWQLAMSMPEYFAAIVPICGGGMYWQADTLKHVPVWAHHGAKDNVVRVEESQKMVDAVNARGGNARLTIYPDLEHNSWDATLSNPEVYRWLFSHKRHTTSSHPALTHQGEAYG